MTAPTSQTKPLPPSPSEQGILVQDTKSLISMPWVQWFLSLAAKVNTINENSIGWSKVPINNGTPGTYGDSTHYPVITTNVNGLVTNVTLQTFSSGGGSGGVIPVVDGSIPPVFTQLGDGNLVYVGVTV